MNKVFIVPSPEAWFRPERFIKDAIVAELVSHTRGSDPPYKVMMPTLENFYSLGGDFSNFYSPEAYRKYTAEVTAWLLDVVLVEPKPVGSVAAILFMDAWSPVTALVSNTLRMAGRRHEYKLFGIMHSSTNIEADKFGRDQRAHAMEVSAIAELDTTIVGTNYLRDLLLMNGVSTPDRIEVTGLPIPKPAVVWNEHRDPPNVVAFNHRWAPDKDVESFVTFVEDFNAGWPDLAEWWLLTPTPIADDKWYVEGGRKRVEKAGIKVKVTTEKTYPELLDQVGYVISTARLETWGYSVLEVLMRGGRAILPRRACYPEMYHDGADTVIWYDSLTVDGKPNADVLHALHDEFYDNAAGDRLSFTSEIEAVFNLGVKQEAAYNIGLLIREVVGL